MKLTSIKKRENITAECEVVPDVFVTVAYIERPQMSKLFSDSQTVKRDDKTGVRAPVLDQEKLCVGFCGKFVTNWRGATPARLASVLPLDLTKLTDAEQNEEIAFNQEDMQMLYREGYGVDAKLQEFAMDLPNFRPEKDAEEKN